MSYNSYSLDLKSAPENLLVGDVLDLSFLVFLLETKHLDFLRGT